MNTKPSLGTGFAGVWAHAVAAGIIASSRGRAKAACALFRNVRLGIAFFVRNITLPFLSYSPLLAVMGYSRFIYFSAPHLKRYALHDSEKERRETVIVFLSVSH